MFRLIFASPTIAVSLASALVVASALACLFFVVVVVECFVVLIWIVVVAGTDSNVFCSGADDQTVA